MYGLLIVINGKITFAIHKHSRNAQKLCDAFEDILLRQCLYDQIIE